MNSYMTQYDDVDGQVTANIDATVIQLNTGDVNGAMALQPFFRRTISYYLFEKERKTGDRYYELADHLGNVRVTISDRRLATISGNTITDYNAEVKSWADYYAFGMMIPGRQGNSEEYRYGFNGKEKDDEVKEYDLNGTEVSNPGTQYDYGFRIYDPRLGRFLSLDPQLQKYPSFSPYSAFANNPVLFIDEHGDTIRVYGVDKSGNRALLVRVDTDMLEESIDLEMDELPEMDKPIVINLNQYIKEASQQFDVALEEVDAYVIDISGGFAFVGGMQGGYQLTYFTGGKDKGWHLFSYTGATLGLSVGFGVEAGIGTFNEESGVEPGVDSYQGISHGIAGGGGVFSATISVSNRDNDKNPFSDSPETWTTRTAGAAVGPPKFEAGGNVFMNRTRHKESYTEKSKSKTKQ